MRHSVRLAAIVLHCQSHIISAQPFRDPIVNFAVLCHDDKCPMSEYMRDFGTIGTYKAVWREKQIEN